MLELKQSASATLTNARMSVAAFGFLLAGASPVFADALTRSVDVNATPSEIWSMMGPFCAVKDWHPAIGTCVMDGKAPVTRTLVTKDGAATFVETQTANSNTDHLYSYAIKSSPLPVTHYLATLKVAAKDMNSSTVTWSSTYTPDKGKAADATEALVGIYKSGLNAIQTRFIK